MPVKWELYVLVLLLLLSFVLSLHKTHAVPFGVIVFQFLHSGNIILALVAHVSEHRDFTHLRNIYWQLPVYEAECSAWRNSSLGRPHPHGGHIPKEWIQVPWSGRRFLVKRQACPRLQRALHLAWICLLPATGVASRQHFPWSGWWGARSPVHRAGDDISAMARGLIAAVIHSCALTLQGKPCAMWGSWRNLLDLYFLG